MKGFPKSWKTERLHDEFSSYGSIVSAKIDRVGPNNESQGFGWVQYEDQASALKAM